MSKKDNKDEKIQIVAFSTNENEQTPNDLFTVLLKQHDHSIIKHSNRTLAFSMKLNDEKKQKKIMICSIFNLSIEYSGIADVNCYILFIDLEKEDSNEKLKLIIAFINQYCNLNKKFYILGMISGKEGENKYLTQEDIIKNINNDQNNTIEYEYKEINISEISEFSNVLMDILIYSSNNPKGSNKNRYEDKRSGQDKSCEIF